MNLQQFTKIEVYALAETIREYTRDHYISNYTRKLIEFTENKQYDLLYTVIAKLVEWYKEELEIMKDNKYIYNLDTHLKSYDLLIQFQEILKQEI